MFKSGYVAIVGSPNAGKSTLLNELLDSKIAITSDKVGTTRNIIRGIFTDEDMQIVFVDTPGINKPQNKLQVYMKNQVEEALNSVNLVIYVLDAEVGIKKRELEIIEKLKQNKKVYKIACINKIDLINQEKALTLIEKLRDTKIFEEVFALSAKNGLNVNSFLKTIKEYLPVGEPIYDKDTITDFSTRFYINEIVREKVLKKTYEEVPHGVYVKVDNVEYKKNSVYITAIIYVKRESQKGIIIGKKASMIKEVGQEAREDLEYYFGKKVFLDLTVRVNKNWDNKDDIILDQIDKS